VSLDAWGDSDIYFEDEPSPLDDVDYDMYYEVADDFAKGYDMGYDDAVMDHDDAEPVEPLHDIYTFIVPVGTAFTFKTR